jgi:DNA-binding NarL/FixJ family response regulator
VSLRVVLADDSSEVLTAMQAVLDAAGHVVVATARTGDEAASAVRTHAPDVAVVDVDMPGGGPDLVRRIVELDPAPRVMTLSGHDDVETVVAMLTAGSTGYVAKGFAHEDLETCVRRCADGVLFVVAACSDQVRARLGG